MPLTRRFKRKHEKELLFTLHQLYLRGYQLRYTELAKRYYFLHPSMHNSTYGVVGTGDSIEAAIKDACVALEREVGDAAD